MPVAKPVTIPEIMDEASISSDDNEKIQYDEEN
jgi:hypothetical protein